MDRVVAERRLHGYGLQFFSKVVEQATEGVALIDLDGIVRFVNIRWAEMHGYAATDQLLGKHIRMFHTEGQMQSDLAQMLDETRRRGLIIGPIDHTKRSGKTFPTQTKVVLLNSPNEPSGFIILAVDCTSSRKNTAQLTEKSAELDELKQANEQLEQAEERSRRRAAELEQQLEGQAAEHRRLQGQLREQAELIEKQSAELTQLGEAKKRLEGQAVERQKLATELNDLREQAEQQITELTPLEQLVGELVDSKTFASEILGVSKMSFRLMRVRGRIGPRPIKVNGSLRWELSSILRWIEWNCCNAAEFKAREQREFEQIPEESRHRPEQISSVHPEEQDYPCEKEETDEAVELDDQGPFRATEVAAGEHKGVLRRLSAVILKKN